MPELTEASLADHIVTFHDPAQAERTVRCAYVTGDDTLPHVLVFKDHEHRTVALVNQDAVLVVERQQNARGVTITAAFPPSVAAGASQTWNAAGVQ